MQAVQSAQGRSDEFVKDCFVTNCEKLPLLVQDLVLTELWKDKVFNRLVAKSNGDDRYQPKASFPVYILLYHELCLANLLETLTFHSDVVESLSDCSVDLVDWAYRSACSLTGMCGSEKEKWEMLQSRQSTAADASILGELQRQATSINFDKGMKAVSLLGQLVNHCFGTSSSSSANESLLPLSTARHLLDKADVVLLFCQLLDQRPWVVDDLDRKGCFVRQEDGQWIEWDRLSEADKQQHQVMPKCEGQIWIALVQILLANQSIVRYDLSPGHRRAAVLKLRSHLIDERKLDALPILSDLRRCLEQLAIDGNSAASELTPGRSGGGAAPPKSCLVEQLPVYRAEGERKYRNKWDELTTAFIERIESQRGREAAQQAAASWFSFYTDSDMANGNLIGQTTSNNQRTSSGDDNSLHECAGCGEVKATKRCSRCQREWYCQRECQVKHWTKHKLDCKPKDTE